MAEALKNNSLIEINLGMKLKGIDYLRNNIGAEGKQLLKDAWHTRS